MPIAILVLYFTYMLDCYISVIPREIKNNNITKTIIIKILSE